MVLLMGVIFIMGYVFISLEHSVKINKAAIALSMSMLLWTLYIFDAASIVPNVDANWFRSYLQENPSVEKLSFKNQAIQFVTNFQLLEHIGDVSEIVFFLLGAMTIVEMIDIHGGFNIITDKITTRNKHKLLWLIAFITFFLSAVIDNMTTAIVMVAMLNKIIPDKQERWWFAAMVIIASNSGGVWSPIGDVTTILLWVKGTVTPLKLMEYVFLPSMVSLIVPLLYISHHIKGNVTEIEKVKTDEADTSICKINRRRKIVILIIGLVGLISVPIYKNITQMPPVTGIMFVLGIIWIITDCLYRRVPDDIHTPYKMDNFIKRIDISTLLFFFGILMAVAALDASGGLLYVSKLLEADFHNIYVINFMIGVISSIVDNVPLVAAALGLYPLVEPSTLQTMTDPSFMANFVPDGLYWHLLTYCAGVGGSLLIIGSAAGVVTMGIEKISFAWYLKKISFPVFIGYLLGIGVFMLETLIFP